MMASNVSILDTEVAQGIVLLGIEGRLVDVGGRLGEPGERPDHDGRRWPRLLPAPPPAALSALSCCPLPLSCRPLPYCPLPSLCRPSLSLFRVVVPPVIAFAARRWGAMVCVDMFVEFQAFSY